MSYQRNAKYPELFRKHEGGPWSCFVPNPNGGRRLRLPTGHIDALAAHNWYLRHVRGDVRAGATRPVEASGLTLLDAIDARMKWIRAARATNDPTRKKLSADTVDFYEKKSRPLLAILGASTPLSEIGHAAIRRYIRTRSETVKASTIGKELTALSMAWRLAKKEVEGLPSFSDIVPEDFQAKYVPRTRWLTEAEVKEVFEYLKGPRAAIFAFLVSTGATYPSEVKAVRKLTHVKDTYLIHIPGTKRGTRNREVHVPSYARQWFRFAVDNLPAGGFPSWGNIRRDFHRAAAALGIVPFSPNDLRRTFAQWLVRSGVPYHVAAAMMGHGSTKMLELVYGKQDARSIGALVEMALKKAPKNARTG